MTLEEMLNLTDANVIVINPKKLIERLEDKLNNNHKDTSKFLYFWLKSQLKNRFSDTETFEKEYPYLILEVIHDVHKNTIEYSTSFKNMIDIGEISAKIIESFIEDLLETRI